jgi:hypothetical protein
VFELIKQFILKILIYVTFQLLIKRKRIRNQKFKNIYSHLNVIGRIIAIPTINKDG